MTANLCDQIQYSFFLDTTLFRQCFKTIFIQREIEYTSFNVFAQANA
eukprot:gene7323-11642_t